MDEKKTTIQSYDKTVEEYIEQVDSLHPKKESKVFLSLIPKNATILDLGCGPGRDSRIFSEKGYRVVGIDLSRKMVDFAKKRAPKATFKVMDCSKLKFRKNTFDGVWASASLLHIVKKDFPKVLDQIRNALKPKGIFYLSLKKGKGEGIEPDRRYGNKEKFWSYFSKKEIEDILKNGDFELVRSYVDMPRQKYATHPWICVFAKNSKRA